MNKKRILHLTKTFYPNSYGGVEKVIYTISNGLNKKFNIYVASTFLKSKNKKIKKKKYKYFKQNFSIFSSPFSLSLLRYVFENRNKFDIYHFHYPWPFLSILVYLIDKKKKKIVTYHSDAISGNRFVDLLFLPFAYIFLKQIDTIQVTSKNYLKSNYLLSFFKKKIVTIPLGIKNKKIQRKRIKYKNFALFLGSYRKYKGIDIIIKAAKKIDYKIILAGQNLNLIKKKINIPNNIKIINNPNESQKCKLLQNCSVLILPSTTRSEAFGLVLLEAAMYFKPAITTELQTGTSEIIKNYINGMIIKPMNSQQLALKINTFIRDKKKAKKMGENNNLTFIKKFSDQKFLKKIESIYLD